jgi:5-methylcytosine-specific restriction endonuclease McrA
VDAELIRPVDVFERDGWICGLCGEAIDPELKFPHPMSASVDHIIPLARGGPHTMLNVQAAHLRGNIVKRDNVAA